MEKSPAQFKKTNYLIEAKYKLGILETFLFTQAYMTLAEADSSTGGHRIYFKDVIENFGLHPKGDTYDNIVKAARSLRAREIIFKPVNESGEEEVEVYTGFFTKVKVNKRKNRELSYLEVFIDDELKPHLIALKRYTLLNKDRYAYICGCLRNPLIIRLYDLLKQYEKIGWRRFKVEELKTILQIEDKYKLYGSLKQKIILEAQTLFRQHADIAFTVREEKSGKSVVSLIFAIQPNVPTNAPEPLKNQLIAENERAARKALPAPKTERTADPVFAEIFEKARGWGVSEGTLADLLKSTSLTALQTGVKTTEEWGKSGKIKDNPAGFFVKAVRENWKSAGQVKLEQLQERKQREEEARRQNAERLATLRIQLDALLDARRGDVNHIIRELTQSDPNAAVRAVQGVKDNAAVVRHLRRTHQIENLEDLQMDDYRQNPALREQVILEIMRQHPDRFAAVQARYDSAILDLQAQVKKLAGVG